MLWVCFGGLRYGRSFSYWCLLFMFVFLGFRGCTFYWIILFYLEVIIFVKLIVVNKFVFLEMVCLVEF